MRGHAQPAEEAELKLKKWHWKYRWTCGDGRLVLHLRPTQARLRRPSTGDDDSNARCNDVATGPGVAEARGHDAVDLTAWLVSV